MDVFWEEIFGPFTVGGTATTGYFQESPAQGSDFSDNALRA